LKSLKSENRNPEQKEDETEQKRITPGSSDNAIKNRNATEITVNPKGPFTYTLRCALLRAAARCCAGQMFLVFLLVQRSSARGMCESNRV